MASLSVLATTTNSSRLHVPPKGSPPRPTRHFCTLCENRSSNSSSKDAANTANTATTTTEGNSSETERPESRSFLRLDRRDVLMGLGGLYGASIVAGLRNMAIGAPIEPPDLSQCHHADGGTAVGKVNFCPPYGSEMQVYDYKFPPPSRPLRMRKPVHLLEKEEIDKYKEAVGKLRELREKHPDDPRGWMQQANVHCQFCKGAFHQVVCDGVDLQVYNSWLFLPWHRWFLHFHERILGKLIDDDTFALPFWNWDTPAGMQMPPIFVDPMSPLHDNLRNLDYLPPAVLSFKYSPWDRMPSTLEEIKEVENSNLLEISNIFRDGLNLPELFMGDPVMAGETVTSKSKGRLETLHETLHLWTGPNLDSRMDTGNFFSADRDPIFFCHHSNVDRMWEIYRSMRQRTTEFVDKDWFDSTFLFVDENGHPVKVKLSDCMDPEKLGYTYQQVDLPWADASLRKRLVKPKAKARTSDGLVRVSEFGSEPRPLKSTVRVLVKRPKQSRSKSEKEGAVEVLIVSGIQVPTSEPCRFNVYITTPEGDGGQVGPDLGAFAGSFVNLPHYGTKTKTHSKLKLGITNLLEDLEAEAAEKLVVSLVPRMQEVTVGGVSIELFSTTA